MVPSIPPNPPQQRTEPRYCTEFAGRAGPDVSRPAYTMAAGADTQPYFDGRHFPASSTMLHGQPDGRY